MYQINDTQEQQISDSFNVDDENLDANPEKKSIEILSEENARLKKKLQNQKKRNQFLSTRLINYSRILLQNQTEIQANAQRRKSHHNSVVQIQRRSSDEEEDMMMAKNIHRATAVSDYEEEVPQVQKGKKYQEEDRKSSSSKTQVGESRFGEEMSNGGIEKSIETYFLNMIIRNQSIMKRKGMSNEQIEYDQKNKLKAEKKRLKKYLDSLNFDVSRQKVSLWERILEGIFI